MSLAGILLGSERTVFLADGVVLPKEPSDIDFNECCYCYTVFGDTSSTDDYKNDYSGFFFERQTSSDTIDFVLIESDGTEYIISDDTYGTFKDFGDITDNGNLSTFILSWKKVLTLLGAGSYTIRKDKNIAGVTISETSLNYELFQYTNALADGSVRIDCTQNGTLRHFNTNFKGSEFKDSLRIEGFFGNKTPKYTQDNIVFSNDVSTQISMSQENEYLYECDELLPKEVTSHLFDFILFGNDIYMNDYNSDNHSYDYVKVPVEFLDTENTTYYRRNRNVKLSLKFSDRLKNVRKENC